jgi:Ca2+-binding RTX toxin-like protein
MIAGAAMRFVGSQRLESLEKRICLSNVAPVVVPVDLRGTALADTSVLLQWSDIATNEIKYVISRSTDNVTYRDVVNTNPGAVTWVDTTVLPDTEYFYRIRATALIGDSATSPPVRITTLATIDDPYAQLDMDTGQLNVFGTPDDDIFGLSVNGGILAVKFNDQVLAFEHIDVYRISILTYNGDDRISTLTGVGPVYIAGGRGNDTIFGNDGADRLDGGPGDDSIRGNAGDDTITGGDGIDLLYGQGGRDLIRGGRGDDRLSGGDDDDTLFGDRDDDRIFGDGGLDSLVGGGGDNRIRED